MKRIFPVQSRQSPQRYAKAPADPTIPKADEVKVGSCPQDAGIQTSVTPVSAEAFMSLQNLFIQRDAHALDDTSKQSLQRHVQKITKGAQRCLATGVGFVKEYQTNIKLLRIG